MLLGAFVLYFAICFAGSQLSRWLEATNQLKRALTPAMSLDINIFINYGPEIARGFLVTIMITAGALLVGLPLGIALAFARLAQAPAWRWPAVAFIEVIRNTPFMIQVFMLFYVLPFYGIRLPSWLVGILSLGVFSSVYYAEIIRAGIESVPRGQMEAARAMGMSTARGMRHIVFPQMLVFVLPPTANQDPLPGQGIRHPFHHHGQRDDVHRAAHPG